MSIYATSQSDQILSLSSDQFSTVYNVLSLAIASLMFTAFFLLLAQGRVAPRYRNALIVSATVCGIATYHYFRIFDNFKESYPPGETVDAAHMLSNIEFNEGYRYVDWFLTVPLLLVETVAVLALTQAASRRLLVKLVPAAALMIVLGYPGEITLETGPRVFWGVLSTLPFLYLLYVLFVELTRALDGKSAQVRAQISNLRWILLASWGVYPIAYAFPLIGGDFFGGAGGFVLRQTGYSIADIVAKALFGILIYRLARTQSIEEDPQTYGGEHALRTAV
ncbi:MAG: Bacteriorhodopsin [Nocardioides sp.]|jgi:bacteriorhodopsin|nr:Bacteriorhodopsin [Nocardioides sp.]